MNAIVEVEHITDSMVRLRVMWFCEVIGPQLWARCRARRPHECAETGQRYKPGALVFRPVGNAQNRSQRILASAIDATKETPMSDIKTAEQAERERFEEMIDRAAMSLCDLAREWADNKIHNYAMHAKAVKIIRGAARADATQAGGDAPAPTAVEILRTHVPKKRDPEMTAYVRKMTGGKP